MLEFRKKLSEKKEASKGIAKAGFTLIELLVVLVILGILVLIAAPRFLGYSKDANVTAMQADAKVLENAALIYNVENEGWPVVNYTPDAIIIQEGEDQIFVTQIDGSKLSDHVQSLKGEFSDYGIVTIGDNQGSVYHIGPAPETGGFFENAGVEDKDGNTHYGVDLVDIDKDEDGKDVPEDDVIVEVPIV